MEMGGRNGGGISVGEIGFTILRDISLAAVFIPCYHGAPGRLLHEFAVRSVGDVVSVCLAHAHTHALQPILKPPHEQKHGRL